MMVMLMRLTGTFRPVLIIGVLSIVTFRIAVRTAGSDRTDIDNFLVIGIPKCTQSHSGENAEEQEVHKNPSHDAHETVAFHQCKEKFSRE